MVDAHHHVWDPARRRYLFLEQPELAPIARRFGPEDLAATAVPAGIVQTIVVQAAPDLTETEELLTLAASDPLITGVVGWIELDAAGGVGAQLQRLLAHPAAAWLVGIRAMAQDVTDPDWLRAPTVREGLAAAAAVGLACDLLVTPVQLPAAVALAQSLPAVSFVLDHGAKPRIADGPRALEPWGSSLRALAELPNVACKLSGLITEADWGGWTPAQIAPFIQVVVEAFGAERLMFGSDWPVCLLAGSYRQVLELARASVGAGELDALFGATARRVYGLAPPG